MREARRGVSVTGTWRGLGMRGNASAAMSLDEVDLAAARELRG
jgi:alkylation response protein AidB-like acyl-CoA dehydrogenase